MLSVYIKLIKTLNFPHQNFVLYDLFKPGAKSGAHLVFKNCFCPQSRYAFVCVMCVFISPMLLINSDVMWYDNPIRLVKQILQLLYDSYSQYH